METRLHTFMDIFDTTFESGGEDVQLRKIVIPIIQRDYAQGRNDSDILRIRTRFLSSLYKAILEKPITLDFVYGDIDSNGVMTPLDGQQRLTTLFLLHWYAAKKENIADEKTGFLKSFSYETRYSARDFCSFLVEFKPSFDGVISNEIVNQAWFPLDWKKDPTISSMLVMIDAIDKVFCSVDDIWGKLQAGAISFYFLPIKDMGLTDELYIKMNSRGKPLTQFEHFKAELERELQAVDATTAKRIIKKIDIEWTDLLWRYRGDDNITDDEFLRYFKFICDVICYHAGGTPQGKSTDEFDLLHEYFSSENPCALENAITLEYYFDCWQKLAGEEPSAFFSRFISHEHAQGKIRVESRYEIDVFNDCLRTYSDSSGRRRMFPLNRIVLLYAFTSYLLHKEEITEEQFARRIRIVNNLILNSEDEISDSEARTSGNRMPAILAQVDSIIIHGVIDQSIERSFAPSQIAEEIEKLTWTEDNPDKAEGLFALEDHVLLQGQISIVGLEYYDLFSKFDALFSCNYDLIDTALMSIGFYGQKEQNGWRYQLGSGSPRNITAWRTLFHKSRNTGFENTHSILVSLLSKVDTINDQSLAELGKTFVEECEAHNWYDWRYYYIKYPIFRPSSYGKYSNRDYPELPYLFSVMQTQSKMSEYSYNPFLKEADEAHLSKDYYGQRLVYSEVYIVCENNSFSVHSKENDEVIEYIPIAHDERGVDIQNRIDVLKQAISEKAFV